MSVKVGGLAGEAREACAGGRRKPLIRRNWKRVISKALMGGSSRVPALKGEAPAAAPLRIDSASLTRSLAM